jgi:CARDB protein/putative VirB-like lipoprotein
MSMKRPLLFLTALAALAACGPPAPRTPVPGQAVPDLSVRSMYLEMEGRQGNCVESYTPYEIRVVVENTGQADAGPFSVEQNGVRQRVDAGLAAGQIFVLHFPGTSPGGRYEAVVDAANEVIEAREDNNSLGYLAPTPTPPALCTPVPTP